MAMKEGSTKKGEGNVWGSGKRREGNSRHTEPSKMPIKQQKRTHTSKTCSRGSLKQEVRPPVQGGLQYMVSSVNECSDDGVVGVAAITVRSYVKSYVKKFLLTGR